MLPIREDLVKDASDIWWLPQKNKFVTRKLQVHAASYSTSYIFQSGIIIVGKDTSQGVFMGTEASLSLCYVCCR